MTRGRTKGATGLVKWTQDNKRPQTIIRFLLARLNCCLVGTLFSNCAYLPRAITLSRLLILHINKCVWIVLFFPPPSIHDYKLWLTVHVHILPSEQRCSTKQHTLTFKWGATGESTIHFAAFSIVLNKWCDKISAKTFLEASETHCRTACCSLACGGGKVCMAQGPAGRGCTAFVRMQPWRLPGQLILEREEIIMMKLLATSSCLKSFHCLLTAEHFVFGWENCESTTYSRNKLNFRYFST